MRESEELADAERELLIENRPSLLALPEEVIA